MMKDLSGKSPKPRLVVVPSDPIASYEAKGRAELLRNYYNPQGIFSEVYVLSPLEKGVRSAYGMTIIGVAEDDFAWAVRELKPDVVRAYGGYWPADLVGRNRVSGIPVVVSVHDGHPANLYPSVKLADRVLCVSESVRSMAIAKGVDPCRIRILPNRVDHTVFKKVQDASLFRAYEQRFPGRHRILHIGRKSPEKNLETVIRALSRLPEEYILIAVGQGNCDSCTKLAAEEGVLNRCHWVDAIRNSELPALMSWCDCLCNPSLYEGFGIVFIEAASCGLPIVTSGIAPMNLYLKHDASACLVRDYLDPATMAGSIRKTVEDGPYREQLSREGVKAARPFSVDYVDSLEVACYEEAMRLKPRRLPSLDFARQRGRKVAFAAQRILRESKNAVQGLGMPRSGGGLGRDAGPGALGSLVVVPSDPIHAYEKAGYGAGLYRYYNPDGLFKDVHIVSPLEPADRQAFGMNIHSTSADVFKVVLKALKPDVVRAYGGYWPSDLVALKRVLGVPVVVSVHDRRPEMIHASVRCADLVICVSSAVADAVRSKGVSRSRIRILPNRINREIFRPMHDDSRIGGVSGRFPAGRHILHVGRKSSEKNLDILIRALARLPGEYTGVFIGQGDEAPYRQLARELGVEDRCFWISSVPNEELPLWYSWCDCMCVPSRAEGFGIVFIEAAACGAPIVTTNKAPMNEYLVDGESALLVDNPDDPQALTLAIQRICDDPALRQRLYDGSKKASERFDVNNIDKQEAQIYRDLFRKRNRLTGYFGLSGWLQAVRAGALAVRSVLRPQNWEETVRIQCSQVKRLARSCVSRMTTRPTAESAVSAMRAGGQSVAAAALRWVAQNELPMGGIRVHSKHKNAYPEVSGYLIPTLLAYGEKELAIRLTRWLLCIQKADGSFGDPDKGESHIFDTGQVLRGLLAIGDLVPGARDGAKRAADYLCSQMSESGCKGFGVRYAGDVPEAVHLYVLPALMEASRVLRNEDYAESAERCLEHYLGCPDALQINVLTHFLAYQLEALIDLGHENLAMPLLDQLRARQRRDGSVAGLGDVEWTCTTGLAQLAVCWYRVGYWAAADKAMGWLERNASKDGGWPGSLGAGANYFPDAEIPWAAKYFLDAASLRVREFMDRNTPVFPDEVPVEDGRFKAVMEVVKSRDRVVEVGCGKGRFLSRMINTDPTVMCEGVDISRRMLSQVPPGIKAIEGGLESIPCPDEFYDVTFSVEAIEHSANPVAAIREMIRITKPGGWIVIIDKEQAQWGRLECPSWEVWPGCEIVQSYLRERCDEVTSEPVTYDGHAADGLMIAWKGRKRHRLSAPEWGLAITPVEQANALVERVSVGKMTPWCTAMIEATKLGDKVLEVGSGTGEISLRLACSGRRVTLLDFNQSLLDAARSHAAALGVEVKTIRADCEQGLPFSDGEFDCVWSSGLLEHFPYEERISMLREYTRVSKRIVVSLVPNAACLAYRAGKRSQELSGIWRYGSELPLSSLRSEYESVGFTEIQETTVGEWHGLNFLPEEDPFRHWLASLFRNLSESDRQSLQQGYLLVTVGRKTI